MLNIRPNQIRPTLKKAVFVLVAFYIVSGIILYAIQEKMLFLPTQLEQGFKYNFEYPFEELFFETDKNTIINALHFKLENPKGVVLYFHGNAGNLSRWGTVGKDFLDRGYDILIMDYRTYGKSIGDLSEKAMYEDAQFCYNYLKKSNKEKEITVYGRSLGTSVATNLASKNNPKQLVLETPYYSIEDVAQSRFPFFPVKLLLKYKFRAYQFLNEVRCPVIMFHGTEDNVIPFESAEKLYNVSKEASTLFIKIEGGNHNNLSKFNLFTNTMNRLFP